MRSDIRQTTVKKGKEQMSKFDPKFVVVLGALLLTVGAISFIWFFVSEGLGKANDAIPVVVGLIFVGLVVGFTFRKNK
jgi:uncharacterized membrane protein HdeD (DUF308 family)